MPLDSLVFVNNTRRCVTNSRPSARRASGLNQEDELDTHGCGNQLKISSHIPQHKLSSARSTRGGGCIFTTFGASPVVIVGMTSSARLTGRARTSRGREVGIPTGDDFLPNLHTTTTLPSPPRRTSRHPGPERKRCSISPATRRVAVSLPAASDPARPADGCAAPDVSLTCFMWRAANLQIGRYPTGPGRKLC
ncbi:hypothetical protein Bbelb_438880 [Branchiostoma belcheri]|nr:hypothetical protein Bbelb_438880 [Branchiostoma belcheri]